jgi:hypothetical protein
VTPVDIADLKENNTFNNPIELASMQIADAADIQEEEVSNSLKFLDNNEAICWVAIYL